MTCCWWCTLDIKLDEPLHLPYEYDDRRRKFKTMGNFCSWECMKTYNLHENKITFGRIQNNITLMRQKVRGKVEKLNCAPSRYSLKKFGGWLSEKEFRESFAPDPVDVVFPDTEHFLPRPVRQEEYVSKTPKATTKTGKEKINEINSSVTKTNTLKLQRPTGLPSRTKANNIESCLGIIRKSQ